MFVVDEPASRWLLLPSMSMPRRSTPDPLAERIGARIRVLRQDAGLTLEKLAYESEVGSKGYMSDVEKGLARPSVETLAAIADRLEVKILDLVTFPDEESVPAGCPKRSRSWGKCSNIR